MSLTHLERLRRVRDIVSAGDRYDTMSTKLLCFGAAGFSQELRREAQSDAAVVLVDPERLYQ